MDGLFNADGLIREEHYTDTMENTVLPYLKERAHVRMISGDGGRPLYTVSLTAEGPAEGSILLVHGFTENAYKYAELVNSLLHNGLNVVIYDQRGHGRSWRSEAITDPSLTHVTDFNEYVRDMEAVVDQLLRPLPKPWLLFSHSMGGAVSALYLEKHQDIFTRAAFCAPMIAPNAHIPEAVGELLCGGASLMGKSQKRVFSSRPYSGPEDFATSCATGKARFDWYDHVKELHREFWNNGPTYGWTLQSLRVTARILAAGEVEKIACPVRVYTAEHDGSVLPHAQELFAGRLKDGKRAFIKGARHEIYRSDDEVLYPWWHGVLAFLKGNGDQD